MRNRRTILQSLSVLGLGIILLWALPGAAGATYPYTVTDDAGRTVPLPAPPVRIVSRVPMVTDILRAIGADEQIVTETGDLIFYTPGEAVTADLRIAVQPAKIQDDLKWIEPLGALTGRGEQARSLLAEIRGDLVVAEAKTASLPPDARLPMLGVTVQDGRLVPLTGPRQADLISRAGGRPAPLPLTYGSGDAHMDALQRFDPQLIFAASEERREVLARLKAPRWRQLTAVKNRRIYFFPDRLLGHNLAHVGYLVNALASRAYPERYTDPLRQVRTGQIFCTRRVPIDLAMVAAARICHHYRYDFISKTLVVDLKTPQKVLSTLEGLRTGVRTVGNHYAASPCWWLAPHSGMDSLQKQVLPVIGRPAEATSLLFTGADMDHLAVETATFKEMRVTALVTAGVRANAMRLSRDRGNYYEPGTINIILMSNMRLSERAMARALVTATEAKTAALWDLDIRSSYTPRQHAATGTGTDNLIVVQNSGAETRIDNSGGHTKMGELIATAVYRGVQSAIEKQNGLTGQRGVGARLAERRIEIGRLVTDTELPEGISAARFEAAVEKALQRPEVENLVTAAMGLEDAAGRGLTRISRGFGGWCRQVAADISGQSLTTLRPLIEIDPQTPALNLALNAIWNGVLTGLERPEN